MEEKITCPVHGNPLKVIHGETSVVGICVCDVKNNRYKGKKVYEKLLKKAEKITRKDK